MEDVNFQAAFVSVKILFNDVDFCIRRMLFLQMLIQ